jgi:hypothetical protein
LAVTLIPSSGTANATPVCRLRKRLNVARW